MTYAKFYVKILRKFGLPHLRRQATVRPSMLGEHGPVSVSRRCAAEKILREQRACTRTPHRAYNAKFNKTALWAKIFFACGALN